MQFYEINICQVRIFRSYTVYNKQKIIKIGNQTREKSQVLTQGSNNFVSDCIQWHFTRPFYDAAKLGCDHDEAINRVAIRLKPRCHAIPAFRFIVEYLIQDAPVYDVVSKVAEAMVAQYRNK